MILGGLSGFYKNSTHPPEPVCILTLFIATVLCSQLKDLQKTMSHPLQPLWEHGEPIGSRPEVESMIRVDHHHTTTFEWELSYKYFCFACINL